MKVIIVGAGEVGFHIASHLALENKDVVVIDKNPNAIRRVSDNLDVQVVTGSGSSPVVLEEVGIQDMDIVITLTQDEETNILASLLAKRMGARNTITRISKFSYFPLTDAIGIEQVVSPRLSAINTILQHIRKGKVLSAISIKGEQAEVIEAAALETSDIVAKPLHAISFPKGAMVVGIIRQQSIVSPYFQK